MNKTCLKCTLEKPLSEFSKKTKSKDGLQSYCVQCQKIMDAAYYAKCKVRTLKRNEANKQKKRDWLNKYKQSLCCSRCGYHENVIALDFHHNDGKTKAGPIARLVYDWSITRLQTEIAKCDVLCANCHRVLHYEERNNGRHQYVVLETGSV